MDITLKANQGELVVEKYTVNYPFSVHSHHKNANKILRTTSSLKCKNIQGSFRLYYSRKIDFTKFTANKEECTVIGGKLESKQHSSLKADGTAAQNTVQNRTNLICFERKLFLYVNERKPESYLNDKKQALPMWLVKKIDDIKQVVNFTLQYEKSGLKLNNEEILIYLELEYMRRYG